MALAVALSIAIVSCGTPWNSKMSKTAFEDACTGGANDLKNPTSLLCEDDSNSLTDKALGDCHSDSKEEEDNNSSDPAKTVRDRIKKQLAAAQKARKLTQATPSPVADEVAREAHRRAIQRMKEFLLSGEPILIAEVGHWLVKQPLLVHNELIASGKMEEQALLFDLAELSQHLAHTRLSPWDVRLQLEERYGKSLIMELTTVERREWVRSIARQDE